MPREPGDVLRQRRAGPDQNLGKFAGEGPGSGERARERRGADRLSEGAENLCASVLREPDAGIAAMEMEKRDAKRGIWLDEPVPLLMTPSRRCAMPLRGMRKPPASMYMTL